MTEEITSPPYPSPVVNSISLYRYLDELRSWTVVEQCNLVDLVNEEHAEKLQPPEPLSPLTIWEAVPVADKYYLLRCVRGLRELWDSIVRDFDQVWDSPPAIARRLYVVRGAMSLLGDAFVDPETREAKQQAIHARRRRQDEAIQKKLHELLDGALDVDEFEDDENDNEYDSRW